VNLLTDAESADPQSSETQRRGNGMTVEDIYVEQTQPPFAAL